MKIDIALAIEYLVPSAEYGGSTTANTKEAYEKLRWTDKRKKPKWSELEKAYEEAFLKIVEVESVEQLVERKIKEMVSVEALRSKL